MTALLYHITAASVLAFSIVLSAYSMTAAEPAPFLIYFITFAVSLTGVLLMKLKAKARLFLVGTAAALICGILLSVPAVSKTAFLHTCLQFLWIPAAGITAVLFERLSEWNPRLRLIPCICGCMIFAVCLISRIQLSKPAVLFILLYMVITVIDLLQRSWKKEGNAMPEAHTVYTFPFIALLFFCLFFFNAPDHPYEWQFVRTVLRKARVTYELFRQSMNHSDDWDSGEAEVGFAEDTVLFKNLKSAPYEVISVTSGLPSGTRFYLAGKYFDTFDGRAWTKQDNSSQSRALYDTLETICAVKAYDPAHVQDYIRSSRVKIEYRGIRTSHIFAPAKCLPYISGYPVHEIGGDLYFADRNKRAYELSYWQLNRDHEAFAALISSISSNDSLMNQNTFAEALRLIPESLNSTSSVNELLACRNEIKLLYGQKPAISARMKTFLDAERNSTQNDWEFLTRIETLLSGMTYTRQPGELPEAIKTPAEFLDYLIFDSKEGYCTHFATAFVLIARAYGIPARFAEGYCFPASDGKTEVRSDMAHAWPEAYIRNIGWIRFEPTPGFKSRYRWKTSGEKGASASDSENSAMLYGTPGPDQNTLSEPEINQPGSASPAVKVNLYFLMPVLLFLILFVFLERLIHHFRYRRMSESERAAYQFRRCMRILKYAGFHPDAGETLSEFIQRASSVIPSDALHFIFVYEEIVYGGRDVSAADTELFRTSWQRLFQIWIRTCLPVKPVETDM